MLSTFMPQHSQLNFHQESTRTTNWFFRCRKGRRRDLLRLDVVDVHVNQALRASTIELVAKASSVSNERNVHLRVVRLAY